MNGEIHELCAIFPEMSDVEIDDLAKDIAQVGLIDPIITLDGKILDGRNRYRACIKIGVPPRCEEWSDQAGSPLRFVVSRNLTRRNLTPSQRAAIALDVKDKLAADFRERQTAGLKRGSFKPKTTACLEENNDPRERNIALTGKSSELAAAMMHVSPRYVEEAQAIRDQSPKAHVAVRGGLATIAETKRILADPAKLHAIESGSASILEFKKPRVRRTGDLSREAYVAARDRAIAALDRLLDRFSKSDDVAVSEEAHDLQQHVFRLRESAALCS